MDNEAINSEYQDVLTKYTRTAKRNPSFGLVDQPFILVDKLQDWLRSAATHETTHAQRLLHVAYSKRGKPGIPFESSNFEPGDDCCLLVFCILHTMGQGNLINIFSRKKKTDGQLPLRRDTLQNIFGSAKIQGPDMSSKFFDLQHRFCPHKFDLLLGADLEEERVIPIREMNHIKQGGTADLWQICVPEDFVGRRLREVSAGSKHNAGSEEEPEWQYQFALKTFHGRNHPHYQNELDAFSGLKGHEGMVQCLGDYKVTFKPPDTQESAVASLHENKDKYTTYNILLEYGEMDLGDYFGEVLPPVLPSEIEAFWRSLFPIADALKAIHNLKVPGAGIAEEYYGWHTDIKPDNILYVEDRIKRRTTSNEGEIANPDEREKSFKLTDPGFAKFVKKSQKQSEGVPKQILSGGTETFGAPEYPGQSGEPVSQAIDIWSLGCVFSLAATWIILDHSGLKQYNKVRQLAISKKNQVHRTIASSQNQVTEKSEGDHFHNGHDVLEDVTIWHKHLRGALRRTDTITSQVLDLVDQEMLRGSAEDRITANSLCSRLDSILESSFNTSEPRLSDTIKTVLSESVAEATSKAASKGRSRFIDRRVSQLPGSVKREDRKSVAPERPLEHNHHSTFRPNQSLTLHSRNLQDGTNPHSGPTAPPQLAAVHTSQPLIKSPVHERMPSDTTIHMTPTRTRPRAVIKRHSPVNVFQAREANEERRKKPKFSVPKLWINRSKHDEVKDGLLTSYFQGERDIIFLVDNAESMEPHWYEATYLLETLVDKAEGLDEDGMDLRFTTGPTKLEGKDSAEKFVNSMRKARPTSGARTDLRNSLGDVLANYQGKLREKAIYPTTKVKDVVLIVLTDGIWADMEDIDGVTELLKKFSKELERLHHHLKYRPFGIEFIQFGIDESATHRLIHLDEYLPKRGLPDFIDTEHSSGDVNKMLLGSFVEAYDKDEGDEVEPQVSPYSPRSNGEREIFPTSNQVENGASMTGLRNGMQHLATGPDYQPNGSGALLLSNG